MEDLFAANPRNLKLPTTGPALLPVCASNPDTMGSATGRLRGGNVKRLQCGLNADRRAGRQDTWPPCSISWTPFATQSSFPCAHVSRCLTLVITTVRANVSIDELARTYIAKIERQQRAQSTGRFPLIRDTSECARHFSCGNAVPINVRRENSL